MNLPKQCPFCGWNEINLLDDFKIGDEKCYMCRNCQAVAKESMWDNRPIEEGLMARIDELEKRIQRI